MCTFLACCKVQLVVFATLIQVQDILSSFGSFAS